MNQNRNMETNRTMKGQTEKIRTGKGSGNRRIDINDQTGEHKTGTQLYTGLTRGCHDSGEEGQYNRIRDNEQDRPGENWYGSCRVIDGTGLDTLCLGLKHAFK